jgi:signal transduction histidine kinase
MSKAGVLSRKLLLAILLSSSLVTLLMTGFILWRDYQSEVSDARQALEHIQLTYLDSVAISLWNMDETQLEAQLQGMVNLPYVEKATVSDEFGVVIEVGETSADQQLEAQDFELLYTAKQRHHQLGVLTLQVDHERILAAVYGKAVTILVSQFVRTLLISAVILLLVNRMITRHLDRLAAWADRDDLSVGPTLQCRGRPDELTRLVQAIDRQRQRVLQTLAERDLASARLQELNNTLEQQVENRTRRLSQAFQSLQQSMEELRSTQQQLVTSEKMAQLGGLIAGVAHELNTPLGTALTAHSFLKEQLQQAQSDDDMHEALALLENNLQRAIAIVNTFKRLAVQPQQEARRRFRLSELGPELFDLVADYGVADRLQLDVQLADVWLNTYQSSFITVVRSILANSIEHGYPEGGPMQISITARCDEEDWLTLEFIDDGIGMSEEIRAHAFDPFYTTRRSQGSTGLGLHLVYNLVSQILAGQIRAENSTRGAHLVLTIPVDVTREEQTLAKGSSESDSAR